jgi:hypothetical protein
LNRWVLASSVVAGCAGIAAYVYLVDPNTSSAYPQCPLKHLTGLDCPGCGGLRATHSLLHGDIGGALNHNVLAVIIVPVLAYMIVRWMFQLFDRQLPAIRLPRWSAVAIPVVILAFTVVRNIPWGPFVYLNSAA